MYIKFVMHVNIKIGQHNHKAIIIVAANIVCTCMQHRSVIKHGSTLHVLCSDVCCIASALYWDWLLRVLSGLFPACLSVCPGSFVLSFHPVKILESLVETELLSCVKSAKNKIEYEYGLDHVGSARQFIPILSTYKNLKCPVLSKSLKVI